MNVLPIVQRELRVLSRRPATYYGRLTTGGVMLVVLMPLLLSAGRLTPMRQTGGMIFTTLIGIAFLFSIFAGTGLTSDCVSAEKRDGTLGLLFLTDLTGFDVVMGKLAANGLVGLYGLFGVAPVLAITLMLGGVTFGQVATVTLALLNAMFLSLAAGVLASSLAYDRRRSGSLALFLILLIAVGGPICGASLAFYLDLKGVRAHDSWFVPFSITSPGFAFVQAAGRYGAGSPRLFWGSLAVTHLLGWGIVLLTSRVVPRVWQDKPATAARRRLLDRLRDLFQGSASTRKLYRQRLLDLNPVTWLVSRDRLKTLYPWCFLLAALALWLSGLAWLRKDWLSVPATVMTMILIHGAFRLWIGSEAARRFSDDLRSGALELVLSSSLKLDEILGGQLLALRRQFLRASIAVLGGDVALLLLCLGSGQNLNGQEIIELCVAVVAGMIMFVADMFTLGWVGMWHGISARDPNRASGSAAGQILLLPWAYLSALWTCYGVFYGLCLAGGARVPSPSFGLVLFTWFAIGIGNDLFFWRRSRKRLREEFRSLAMRRYSGTEDKSFLQMLAAFLWRGNAGR